MVDCKAVAWAGNSNFCGTVEEDHEHKYWSLREESKMEEVAANFDFMVVLEDDIELSQLRSGLARLGINCWCSLQKKKVVVKHDAGLIHLVTLLFTLNNHKDLTLAPSFGF